AQGAAWPSRAAPGHHRAQPRHRRFADPEDPPPLGSARTREGPADAPGPRSVWSRTQANTRAAAPVVPAMRAPPIVAATGFALNALAIRSGRASATLAAGQSRTVTLHASRRALRRHRLTHPVVTVRNVDTGGTLTL